MDKFLWTIAAAGVFLIVYGGNDVWEMLNNKEPAKMTFAEFAANGSQAEWVEISGCWVDTGNKLTLVESGRSDKLRGSVYPVRASANDSGPVKLFLINPWLKGGWQLVPPPPPGQSVTTSPLPELGPQVPQTVRGMLLTGLNKDSKTRDALSEVKELPIAEDFALMEPHAEPGSEGKYYALPVGAALLIFAIGLGLWRRRGKSPVSPPGT